MIILKCLFNIKIFNQSHESVSEIGCKDLTSKGFGIKVKINFQQSLKAWGLNCFFVYYKLTLAIGSALYSVGSLMPSEGLYVSNLIAVSFVLVNPVFQEYSTSVTFKFLNVTLEISILKNSATTLASFQSVENFVIILFVRLLCLRTINWCEKLCIRHQTNKISCEMLHGFMVGSHIYSYQVVRLWR